MMGKLVHVPALLSLTKGDGGWRDILSWSDEDLWEQVWSGVEQMRALSLNDLDALAAFVGLPRAEVLASPFTLRAVAIAAAEGAAYLSHESRDAIEWPEEACGGVEIQDVHAGQWDRGVLHIGKYQSFLLDEPLATYNPNHMAKWGPHELLHRALSFHWHDELSEWECYLGARLNELVPVVLWYGMDECGRRLGEGFDRAREADHPRVDEADCVWFFGSEEQAQAVLRQSLHHLKAGIEHFAREWVAIEREFVSGQTCPAAHPLLNASSDAIAYTVGHIARLRSKSTQRCLSRILTDGVHVHRSLTAYRSHIEAGFDRLLFGAIEVEEEGAKAKRSGRLLWDWFQRAAQGGWRGYRGLVRLSDDAAADLRGAWEGQSPDLLAWETRLREAGVSEEVLTNGRGHLGFEDSREVLRWREGMESVAPMSVQFAEASGDFDAWVSALSKLSRSCGRLSLVARMENALAGFAAPQLLSELLRFEVKIATLDTHDDGAERLSLNGEELDFLPEDGWFVAHRGFEKVDFSCDIAAQHAGIPVIGEALDPGPATSYLMGAFMGQISVMPAPAPVAATWEAIARQPLSPSDAFSLLQAGIEDHGSFEEGLPDSAEGWLWELLSCGALVWTPPIS